MVDVDGLVPAVGLPPDLGQDLFARHHDTGPGGQEGEQVELTPGQVQWPVVQYGFAALGVDGQSADPEHLGDGSRTAAEAEIGADNQHKTMRILLRRLLRPGMDVGNESKSA